MRKLILLVAAATALLSACSSQQPDRSSEVASLPDASGSSSTSSEAPANEDGRPQLRLDSSEEEVNLAWRGYYDCLGQHGHKMLTGRGDAHSGPMGADGTVNSPDMQDDSPQSVQAREECQNKLPLGPPELDQDKNPNYLDDYHAYMKCLTDGGLKVHAIEPFGTGWTYDDGVTQTLSEDQRNKLEKDCQLEAFSG